MSPLRFLGALLSARMRALLANDARWPWRVPVYSEAFNVIAGWFGLRNGMVTVIAIPEAWTHTAAFRIVRDFDDRLARFEDRSPRFAAWAVRSRNAWYAGQSRQNRVAL